MNNGISHVPAVSVQNVVDTTGAGDAFSVGILAGMMEKFDWDKTVQLGCEIAAHKIQHFGSRTGLPKREMIAALKPLEN